jgi:hypothetical protein
MVISMSSPSSQEILETLIALLADQENVEIKYEIVKKGA